MLFPAAAASEPQTPAQPIDYNFARDEIMLNELSNDPIQTAISRLEKQHEEDKQGNKCWIFDCYIFLQSENKFGLESITQSVLLKVFALTEFTKCPKGPEALFCKTLFVSAFPDTHLPWFAGVSERNA